MRSKYEKHNLHSLSDIEQDLRNSIKKDVTRIYNSMRPFINNLLSEKHLEKPKKFSDFFKVYGFKAAHVKKLVFNLAKEFKISILKTREANKLNSAVRDILLTYFYLHDGDIAYEKTKTFLLNENSDLDDFFFAELKREINELNEEVNRIQMPLMSETKFDEEIQTLEIAENENQIQIPEINFTNDQIFSISSDFDDSTYQNGIGVSDYL